MAESSPLQSVDEQHLLEAALEHPFEPTQVPLSSSASVSSPPPAPPSEAAPSSPEDDGWQSAYASQVSEWRAQSASARTKAELARAEWEAIRAREEAERTARGQPPESWDHLGDHITTSTAAASDVVAKSRSPSLAPRSQSEESEPVMPSGSPTQPWEQISASPTSSYPSMSFPEASLPQSPAHQHSSLPHASDAPLDAHSTSKAEHGTSHAPPSTLPSILDNRVAPRTRLSLVLSSLAINLLLPFINGVMLGFGEIFAKDVLVGWLGWKTKRPGSTAAGLGLRR